MSNFFKILGFLKGFKLTKKKLIYIGIVIVILFGVYQHRQIVYLKEEVSAQTALADRNMNNYLAAKDTIRLEKNANQKLVASIQGYQYDINNLTTSNKLLLEGYKKQLNLANDLNKINTLLRADISIKDSILDAWHSIVMVSDSTYKLTFSDVDKVDRYNWRKFDGEINLYRQDLNLFIESSNFSINQGIQLIAGIIEDEKGFNRLKITTPFPGVEFTDVENIKLIDDKLNQKLPQKKNWAIGIGAGYGISGSGLNSFIGIGAFWSPMWLRF